LANYLYNGGPSSDPVIAGLKAQRRWPHFAMAYGKDFSRQAATFLLPGIGTIEPNRRQMRPIVMAGGTVRDGIRNLHHFRGPFSQSLVMEYCTT
jgi:hypothetical protein